jgi:hypothetical protein
MDDIYYVNTGNWSDQTFLSSALESVWTRDVKFSPLASPTLESKVGVCGVYPFDNPHNSEVRSFYRYQDFEERIASLAA